MNAKVIINFVKLAKSYDDGDTTAAALVNAPEVVEAFELLGYDADSFRRAKFAANLRGTHTEEAAALVTIAQQIVNDVLAKGVTE